MHVRVCGYRVPRNPPPPTTRDAQSEKKFYLDQAKKLKDNFNSKYPDYVYRRRPNNSRKKRRPEPNHDEHEHEHDPADPAHLGDPDDPAYDDTSPIDPDDPLGMVPSPQDVQYTRPHAHQHANPHQHAHAHAHLNTSLHAPYHTHAPVQNTAAAAAAACTYPYASDFHAPHHLASASTSARLPHLGHPDPSLGSAGSIGPLRAPASLDSVGGPLAQGYHQPPPPSSLYQNAASQHQHQHGQPSSLYASAGLWDTARTRPDAGGAGGAGAPPRSNWPVLPALDINLARRGPSALPSGLAHPHQSHSQSHSHSHPSKTDPYSPQLPARPWSSATSSSSSSASAGAGTPHHVGGGAGAGAGAGANAFPTLTSAFFPNESPGTKAMDLASPGAGTPAHEYFSPSAAGAGVGAGPGRRQSAEHAGYAGPYGSSWSQQQQQQQQAQQQQQQQQQQYGRATMPYSLQGSPEGGARSATSASASASASASSAHMAYWSDNRFGR